MADDQHLAYGDIPPSKQEGQRGIFGDAFNSYRKNHSGSAMTSIFDKVQQTVQSLGTQVVGKLSGQECHSHTHLDSQCTDGSHDSPHRYDSFADQRNGNDVKWFVDGCGYMWAVSCALEQARESIWILDWWLSPELYLRRPPSRNEQYRVDRMLQAAAQRGVKVNIIVYKEVTQALTRKYLSPTIPRYLHSLLAGTDAVTSTLSKLGIAATFASLEYAEAENPLIAPPVTVSSIHTKHALEALHPNICVFRHPDHLPAAQSLSSSFLSSIQNLSLNAATASKLPGDALKAIYGMNDDIILYWAHHEKLCLVDGRIAFMGGLDLCYGRWDTNQHPLADAHPSNLDNIVFPGQDFNNARIMDFADVAHWENNKLARLESGRMGWSDISICLQGPVVEDLRMHFVERWNFLFDEKYDARKDSRYSKLSMRQNVTSILQQLAGNQFQTQQTAPSYSPDADDLHRPENQPPAQNQGLYFPPPPVSAEGRRGLQTHGISDSDDHPHIRHLEDKMKDHLEEKMHHVQDKILGGNNASFNGPMPGSVACQIVRSCSKWSHGVATEHSIANAYIGVIQASQHFVYIENQFFITATSDAQKPIQNKIGAALVERILRAARADEKYKVIVIMPAIPAFAGDLKDESSLGTRAIMEFQYNSINRGGYSIMEMISKEGFDPTQYIRFYNLRNYDRINVNNVMRQVENQSGVNYEMARREHDDRVDPMGLYAQGGDPYPGESATGQNYERYQQAASNIPGGQSQASSRWDSVSECYMLGGMDIRQVPFQQGNVPEIDAFVSEELYVHSKVLIADDRVVICGSANLNDRSQLGYHDSEIAIIIEDPTPVDSSMNGQPWRASKFAATLRRKLFRKHLGLLPPQDMERPDQNFLPIGIPNAYDYGSSEDLVVSDPLSDRFLDLWNGRAKQNTNAFGRIFHPVPHDSVQTWAQYDTFYERFFHEADREADGKAGVKMPAKYRWGHVVADEFSPGDQGLREMKDLLSTIKGTLVEMPLLFLIKEDIAREGFSLNAFTEDVYT